MSNQDSPAGSQLTIPSRSMASASERIDRCQTFGRRCCTLYFCSSLMSW
jgi:hypothetical protein